MNPEIKVLVEEALRLDAEATPEPWLNDDAYDPARVRASQHTIAHVVRPSIDARFIARARTLLPTLARALSGSAPDSAEAQRKRDSELLYAFQLGQEDARGSAHDEGARMREQLAALTDEQRLDLFREYCLSCGTPDPGCQCWNDE